MTAQHEFANAPTTDAFLDELNQIRETGLVNMMDVRQVRETATYMGLDEVAVYCDDMFMVSRSERSQAWMKLLKRLGDYVDNQCPKCSKQMVDLTFGGRTCIHCEHMRDDARDARYDDIDREYDDE